MNNRTATNRANNRTATNRALQTLKSGVYNNTAAVGHLRNKVIELERILMRQRATILQLESAVKVLELQKAAGGDYD